MPAIRVNSWKSLARNCGPLSEMMRGRNVRVSLFGTLQNDLDVRLLHRLAQVPVHHQTAAARIVLGSTFSVIEGERSRTWRDCRTGNLGTITAGVAVSLRHRQGTRPKKINRTLQESIGISERLTATPGRSATSVNQNLGPAEPYRRKR